MSQIEYYTWSTSPLKQIFNKVLFVARVHACVNAAVRETNNFIAVISKTMCCIS